MDQEPRPEHAPQEGELLPAPASRESGRPRVLPSSAEPSGRTTRPTSQASRTGL